MAEADFPRSFGSCDLHGSRWILCPSLCFVCCMDAVRDGRTSIVRKKHLLLRITEALSSHHKAAVSMLSLDKSVVAVFAETLLGMLENGSNSLMWDGIVGVLAQLSIALQWDELVLSLLKCINKQVLGATNFKEIQPFLVLLGHLLNHHPTVCGQFVCYQANLLQQLCCGLAYPDESLRALLCSILSHLFGLRGSFHCDASGLVSKLCLLLPKALSFAQQRQLKVNGLGFLRKLLHIDEFVSSLMDSASFPKSQKADAGAPSLPLLLKKFLLCGEGNLKIAAVQCISTVISHRPAQYALPFLQADLPEFLFETLFTTDELLIWSIYCCLSTFKEEHLFYTRCHTIYGMEVLLQSMCHLLALTNTEAQREGFCLIWEIFHRQPAGLQLFPGCTLYKKAINVLKAGVVVQGLDVSSQAARAVSAFLRKDHAVVPLPYSELISLLESLAQAMTMSSYPHASGSKQHSVMAGGIAPSQRDTFLINAVDAFSSFCRLAMDCRDNIQLAENPFTAPDLNRCGVDNLSNLIQSLYCTCDTIFVGSVLKSFDCNSSMVLMERFFGALNLLFDMSVEMAQMLCSKLASCGLIKFALEVKSAFCGGNRNASLNAICSKFLCKLCLILLPPDKLPPFLQREWKVLFEVLERGVPQLTATLPELLLLLRVGYNPSIFDLQLALIVLLWIAQMKEERIIEDAVLLESLQQFVLSLLGINVTAPCFTLRILFHLLSTSEHGCPEMNPSHISSLLYLLPTPIDIAAIYIHRPSFLSFVFHYERLVSVLGVDFVCHWLEHMEFTPDLPVLHTHVVMDLSQPIRSEYHMARMLSLVQSCPLAISVVMEVVCKGEMCVAQRALHLVQNAVADGSHSTTKKWGVCMSEIGSTSPLAQTLHGVLLIILQRFDHAAECANLTLVLELLCTVQLSAGRQYEMPMSDFRTFFYVCGLIGRTIEPESSKLRPAFSYLYVMLQSAPQNAWPRLISTVLSNRGMMELMQRIITPGPMQDKWTQEKLSLCCVTCTLFANLLLCEALCSVEVPHSLKLNLNTILLIVKPDKDKDLVLQAAMLQVMTELLRCHFTSSLVTLQLQSSIETLSESPPPAATGSSTPSLSLFPMSPLNLEQMSMLQASLQGHLAQRRGILGLAAATCYSALLDFASARSAMVASHLLAQPWNHILLLTLSPEDDDESLCPTSLLITATMLKHAGGLKLVTDSLAQRLIELITKGPFTKLDAIVKHAALVFLKQLLSGRVRESPGLQQACLALTSQLSTENAPNPHPILLYPFPCLANHNFMVKSAEGQGYEKYWL
uniref:meiosis inhibitor protein 1-like isoform X3 n=1 Tax=Myxine glutinosa TaxID=7769 RepID=UPI00358F76AC